MASLASSSSGNGRLLGENEHNLRILIGLELGATGTVLHELEALSAALKH